MKSPVSRSADTRAAVAAPALAILALAGGLAAATAPADAGFRSVRVDLSGMAGGDRALRSGLAACLSAEMTRTLGGALTPADRAAPALVLRPRVIQLAPAYGLRSLRGGFGDTAGSDYIEGDALVVPAGRFSAAERIPMLAALPADTGSALGDPYANAAWRVDALCKSFAYWIGRQVAGR
jgi:hypothetical protein